MPINNERPAYRVLTPTGFYADDHLWMDGETLYYDGEPNEDLEPLNDLAKEKLTVYLEKLDQLARDTAVKLGRPYVGRPRTLEGALAMASEDERRRISIMGTKEAPKQTERFVPEAVPEVGNVTRKGGRPPGAKNKNNLFEAA